MGKEKIKINVGDRFNELTVVKFICKDKHSSQQWLCKCSCGNETVVSKQHLITEHTKSCGCAKKKREVKYKNGYYNNCYHVWWNMIQRCENPNARGYEFYGGRGVSVCDSWHDFGVFCADMGMRDKGMTLDRIDPDGNYEPLNCRWVTWKEQGRNKRNAVWIIYKGKKYILSDFPHKNTSFLLNHRYDGTLLIDGGKYDNKEWYIKFHGIGELDNE